MTDVRSLSTSQRIAITLTQALSLVLDEGKPAVILVRSRADGEDLLRRLQESEFPRLLWGERITISRTESRDTGVFAFENDIERWSRTVSFQSHTRSLKICLFGGYAKFALGRFGKMYVELYGLPEFDRILYASASSAILVQEGVFLDLRVLEASSADLAQAAQEFFSINRISATEEESPAQAPTGQRTGMSEPSPESQGEEGFRSQASMRVDFGVELDAWLEERRELARRRASDTLANLSSSDPSNDQTEPGSGAFSPIEQTGVTDSRSEFSAEFEAWFAALREAARSPASRTFDWTMDWAHQIARTAGGGVTQQFWNGLLREALPAVLRQQQGPLRESTRVSEDGVYAGPSAPSQLISDSSESAPSELPAVFSRYAGALLTQDGELYDSLAFSRLVRILTVEESTGQELAGLLRRFLTDTPGADMGWEVWNQYCRRELSHETLTTLHFLYIFSRGALFFPADINPSMESVLETLDLDAVSRPREAEPHSFSAGSSSFDLRPGIRFANVLKQHEE